MYDLTIMMSDFWCRLSDFRWVYRHVKHVRISTDLVCTLLILSSFLAFFWCLWYLLGFFHLLTSEIGTFSILYVAALVMTALSWSDKGLCLRSWWCVSRMYLCHLTRNVAKKTGLGCWEVKSKLWTYHSNLPRRNLTAACWCWQQSGWNDMMNDQWCLMAWLQTEVPSSLPWCVLVG